MDREVEAVIDKIRAARIEKGISVVTLSVESGVSRSHLFYIESKKTVPSLDTLARIARALGLRLKDLFD